MAVVAQLDEIKKKYEDDMAKLRLYHRRKELQYHSKLAKHIVNAIMSKRVTDGNRIRTYMRMDYDLPLSVTEVNALLSKEYIKVKNIHVESTSCNSCIINPPCMCCCPCIFFPQVAINWMFGTTYEIHVYLDV